MPLGPEIHYYKSQNMLFKKVRAEKFEYAHGSFTHFFMKCSICQVPWIIHNYTTAKFIKVFR